MISEKQFEDIVCKYPELIEGSLSLKGRQIRVYGKIMDVLFEDKFGQRLIVELKIGPIDRKHIGQVMEYEGSILSVEDPTARIMLVGNRVPPNLKKALDHHGIEWKEITFSHLKKFLHERNDHEKLALFIEMDTGPKIRTIEQKKKQQEDLSLADMVNSSPALFIPVEGKWIEQTFQYFSEGREMLYFYTNANIGWAKSLNIKNVYFKCKGTATISAKADLMDITEHNQVDYRLLGFESDMGKYYYGFNNLQNLEQPINIVDLKYYKTGNNLRVDIPGACIIVDPLETGKQEIYTVKSILAKVKDANALNWINELRDKIKDLDKNITEYCRKGWIQYKTNKVFCGIDAYHEHFIVFIKLHSNKVNVNGLDIRPLKDKHYIKIKIHPDTNLDSVIDLIKKSLEKEKQVINGEETLVEKGGNIWIFQVNPDKYDILGFFSNPALKVIHWLVSRYQSEIRKGDTALIWMSGMRAGIYAIGEVISDPTSMSEPPEERKYWASDSAFKGGRFFGVAIKITRKLINNPIFRYELQAIPELKNLSILKFWQGTNFPVRKDEWKIIRKII